MWDLSTHFSFFDTRILLMWMICPTTELFFYRQYWCASCQLLLSTPVHGHFVYGDNIGLIHILVILLEPQCTSDSVGWITSWWTPFFVCFVWTNSMCVTSPLDTRRKLNSFRPRRLTLIFVWTVCFYNINFYLVLGINYFVIITRPLHPIPVRKRCSSSCYMIETYNTHHRFPCYWTMNSHILNGIGLS